MDWNQYKNNFLKDREGDEIALIERAFKFAYDAHKNQKRLSGEPYFSHPLNISKNIISLNFDAKTISAALLHDTIEDTDISLKTIKKNFGEEVAFLVDGITKVNVIKYKGAERSVESIKKMFLAVAQDIRVVILKLFDRLNNMETLFVHSKEKQKRIAVETLDIYASIADRLGIGGLKAKLEDLAFPYVYPEEHKWLLFQIKEKISEREEYLKKLVPVVSNELKSDSITQFNVSFRAKNYYSIWKKLQRCDMDLSRINDLAAIRIIVKNIEDCYAVLGIIHKFWKPLPGKIKDYIALPKPNGYQSLHTTVFCEQGKITEFQIRTEEMERDSEYGIAAHWFWEELGKPKKTVSVVSDKFLWVSQLRDWQKEFKKNGEVSSEDFLESLKIDFFRDRIFTLTPKGDVIDLPEGATPLDFAYAVHSEIGDKANGAKVNGKMVSLSHNLSSGNIVEILVQKNRKPSLEWLNFVKTQQAKNRIRRHFKLDENLNNSHILNFRQEYKVVLKVSDRVGLLKDIGQIFSDFKINVQKFRTTRLSSKYTEVSAVFFMKDRGQLDKLKSKLRTVNGINEVKVI